MNTLFCVSFVLFCNSRIAPCRVGVVCAQRSIRKGCKLDSQNFESGFNISQGGSAGNGNKLIFWSNPSRTLVFMSALFRVMIFHEPAFAWRHLVPLAALYGRIYCRHPLRTEGICENLHKTMSFQRAYENTFILSNINYSPPTRRLQAVFVTRHWDSLWCENFV